MDYLITGGAGFIGSNLAERLAGEGASVRVVDNFVTGRRENLDSFKSRVEFIEGDLAEEAFCRQVCKGVCVVLHQAALPSVPKSVADPCASHRCNLEATFQLLVAARDAKVRRFVYAASSSAYGESPTLPKIETMPCEPLSPYAAQKLAGEHYCTVFSRCYGLETISLRYFNVFGPRQDPKSQYAAVIPAFVTAILGDCSPIVYGDGEQTRDFTYIDNVVEANLLAAQAERTRGEVVNIACGQWLSLLDIIGRINQSLGKNISPKFETRRPGDIQHSWADIGAAARVIGYRPKVLFDEGLARTIHWYRERESRV